MRRRHRESMEGLRVVPWLVPYKRTTQGTRQLPARSGSLALQLARGRGSPPLRFASTRGPPSSTNTSQMFMARPDAEWRAGASGQQQVEDSRTATSRAPIGTQSYMARGTRRRIVGAVGATGRNGREVVGDGGWNDRAGSRRPCAGRSDEASTAASRGAALAFLHGRWVARSGDPLRGGERRFRRALAAFARPNVGVRSQLKW